MVSEKALNHRLFLEPFQWAVYVAAGAEELLWYMEKKTMGVTLGEGMSIGNVCGICQEVEDEDGNPFTLLYFSSDSLDHDTIGHECLHLVHQMLDSRGVPINGANTEIMAYMQEYVVYEVKKVLTRRGHLPKGSAKREGRVTV